MNSADWFKGLRAALAGIEGGFQEAKDIINHSERIFLIGNGGSAAIASHIATDFTKNGGLTALAFNDTSLLTCYANDFGYEEVFSKAIHFHCIPDDCLIAISSSGKSENILNGVDQAREMGMEVITLSGFKPDNPLRFLGDVNFYVPSDSYGHVEITHLAILHSMV